MAVSGSGTISDPYIPVTFGDFLSVCGQENKYVCLQNDIDVSKDNVYKTGLTSPLNIRATIYGTAMTYNSGTTYNQYDKCTWNDGEHGLCTYTCNVNGTVGIDVSDTTHWTRGGNPIKKITGLIITAQNFIKYRDNISLSNVFFESCAFFAVAGSTYGLIGSDYSNFTFTFNDCSFSFFYNQIVGDNPVRITQFGTYFNRCSLYFRFNGPDLSNVSTSEYRMIFSYLTYMNNCTIDLENISILGVQSSSTTQFGFMNSCSFRMSANLYSGTTGRGVIGFNGNNCFFAFTALKTKTSYTYTFAPNNPVGVNIIDYEVVGNATITPNSNLIQGTTAQCKDKDWLISKGFFTS